MVEANDGKSLIYSRHTIDPFWGDVKTTKRKIKASFSSSR